MNTIIKFLKENNINFIENKKRITITLENNCVWINGYGEKMYYNKTINIIKDTYANYILTETMGYNKTKTLLKATKQSKIIDGLKIRLNI